MFIPIELSAVTLRTPLIKANAVLQIGRVRRLRFSTRRCFNAVFITFNYDQRRVQPSERNGENKAGVFGCSALIDCLSVEVSYVL